MQSDVIDFIATNLLTILMPYEHYYAKGEGRPIS